MTLDYTTLAARQSLSLAHIEEALNRWRKRPVTVIHTTVAPVDAMSRLRDRMIATILSAIRWLDLNGPQRHALAILYPRPVGCAWPGLPPA
ncbi:hypothetical protein V4C53_44200 [Paraburkholderia azotifigens]|uniref:hypothetical protein n=1 Tax=Paraburkholderia azotifigens TaxID=2057004 RepID=UPI00316C8BFC